MRVFLTGATGFIGSRIVPELIGAGHQVLGMTRSDRGARQLEEAGAEVHRGTLEDPASLAAGAATSDVVIHTAFDHDFSRFEENLQKERRAIEALGGALAGSDRPLIITSGVGMGSRSPGEPATEDVLDRDNPNPHRLSELTGEEVAGRGVSVAVVRLSHVHDTKRQGMVSPLVQIARQKGVSAYVGDGANRWPAVHHSDVARLYRLALEHHAPGTRWHAVDEEGVAMRDVAEAIGVGLGVPVRSLPASEADEHFGWLGAFVAADLPASSHWTRERLGWRPKGRGLIEDLRDMDRGETQNH